MDDLTTNVVEFCEVLRREHNFAIGHAEAHDALCALETLGVTDESRVRSALRLVCCGTREQTIVFDGAFDRFFRQPIRGLRQAAYQPRDTRPGREKAAPKRVEHPPERPKLDRTEAGEAALGIAAQRRDPDGEPDDATAWQMLRARYSPAAASGQSVRLPAAQFPEMLAAANRVISSVRLGRSRRWKAVESTGRFDLRRTIRASLQTGGDPVTLRFLGHPLRNPRFVLLVDGSRSMSDQTAAALEFARALCHRSTRTNVFFFSTELRDVTAELRAPDAGDGRLIDLGQAWGGGTKIGANLAAFVEQHSARLLTQDTLIIVYSDGLDVGDIPQLERALREIDRRSAGIVWLNPHAALPDYAPSARGMRAALPYLTLLTAANDAKGFAALALLLARDGRIRGRRR